VQSQDEILEHITRTIVERFNPYRIVLFGSRARGDAAEDSEYDIFVEMESDLRPWARVAAVHRAFGMRSWSMDVLVLTPAELLRTTR